MDLCILYSVYVDELVPVIVFVSKVRPTVIRFRFKLRSEFVTVQDFDCSCRFRGSCKSLGHTSRMLS